MSARTATIEPPRCPECSKTVPLPIGTEVPSPPNAIFWRCECSVPMLVYLDVRDRNNPRIRTAKITMPKDGE